MFNPTEDLLKAFDGHDVEAIRAALEAGANASAPVRGKAPIYWLIGEYTRSDRFPTCIQLLLENGAELEDPFLAAVLRDDASGIRMAIADDPSLIAHRTSPVSSFTSLEGATLLHAACEFGNKAAAGALIELGADVNSRAGVDKNGIGGHTPIFHTVNSNRNRSAPIMKMLVEAGADCTVQVKTVAWGKGYPWETVFFDVTPISYAQMGLLPQVHRTEEDIYANIGYMLKAVGRPSPELGNIPKRYLQPKGRA